MNNRFEFDLEAFGAQPFFFEDEEEIKRRDARRMPPRRPAAARKPAGARRGAAGRKLRIQPWPPKKPRPRPSRPFPFPVWPGLLTEPVREPRDQEPRKDSGPSGTPPPPPDTDQARESSERVRWVQVSLNQVLNLNLPTNGVMDAGTRDAIRSFQQREGLPATGVVGPDTEQALVAATRRSANGKAADASRPARDDAADASGSADDVAADTSEEFFEFEVIPSGVAYDVAAGETYGSKWKTQRPPGLPQSARLASRRGEARPYIEQIAGALFLGNVFVATVKHLAQTESGARFALPANIFDARPQPQRPAGKALITAWGAFQFNRDAWRALPGVASTAFPWDSTPYEELSRPINRYAQLFLEVIRAGGSNIDAARGIRLWHRSPAAYRQYVNTGRSRGFQNAWRQVDASHRLPTDKHLRDAGIASELEWGGETEMETELLPEVAAFAEPAEFSLSQFPQSVLNVLNQGLFAPAVKLAIAFGYRNETQLTDLLFNARHPERFGRAITRSEPGYQSLVSEWINIRNSIVRPALSSAAPTPAAPSGTTPAPAGSPDIVNVRGIKVARQIAPQIGALLSAAEADGVRLSGGGYRSPQEQIRLRMSHCGASHYDIYEKPADQCTPPTARPGRSNHERGLAIDFTYNGKTIKSHDNPGFQWLAANAARFGLKNLPSEAWHWSVDGR